MVYGCDGPWWRSKNGLPGFTGVKLAHDTEVCADYPDVHKVEIAGEHHDLMLFDKPGVVGHGGNSGFQALNLVVQFGAVRVLLVGFDMHGTGGAHWYGLNNWRNGRNPSNSNYAHWRLAFSKQAKVLASMNVDVVNTSPESALTCFRTVPVEQALREWGL